MLTRLSHAAPVGLSVVLKHKENALILVQQPAAAKASNLTFLWGKPALNEYPAIEHNPTYFLVLWCATAESGL